MKLLIDTRERTLTRKTDTEEMVFDLYSKAAFDLISDQWLRVGWTQKYSYTFTWFGRPIVQLPEDLVRAQEIIYRVRPEIIIETGVAHGGSLIFYATLCKAMGRGRVIGIDIEIRPQNRREIEVHDLGSFITLIEGSSIAPETIAEVHSLVKPSETVIIFLDSNHTKQHVAAELHSYYNLVTPGSYIVATDGVMKNLYDVPNGRSEWEWNNPSAAAKEFAAQHPEFILEQPAWEFNESSLSQNITHWPDAWLRRK